MILQEGWAYKFSQIYLTTESFPKARFVWENPALRQCCHFSI